MAKIIGTKVVFGLPTVKGDITITNLPKETQRVKVRLRNDSFARVFIKTKSGVRHFFLAANGEDFEIVLEQGLNYTVPKL